MPRVRPAHPADRERIREIHVAAVEAFAPDAYDDEQVAAWADWSDVGLPDVDDDGHWIVVEREGASVGFGRIEIGGGGTVEDETRDEDGTPTGNETTRASEATGEVTACYVDPDHAGEDVGSTIMAALEGYARGRGLEAITLWASRNAVGFYERLGYARSGAVDHQTSGDVTLSVEEMTKSL